MNKAITVLSVLLVTIILSSCGKKEVVTHVPPEVKIITSLQKDIPIKQEWVGQTFGAEDVEIRARVEGYIQRIHFAEGTQVSKGTLLYTIEAKELIQNVADAQGRLTAAQTMLVQAESDVKRYTPLAESGAVSQRTLEIAIANYEARKGDVASALAYLRLARINLGYSNITAPISGIIGISNYKTGDYVGKIGSGALNTISNVDPIHVRFSISEQEYLGLVKMYMNNDKSNQQDRNESVLEMILADGSVFQHTGKVNVLQRQVDPSTGTLMLEGSFANPDRIVRPGQFAKIRTIIRTAKDAVIVPEKCIFEIQGQKQAYVINGESKVELRILKTGEKFGQFVIIESGIKANEKVISDGILKVKPDITVKVLDVSSELDSILIKEGLK